MTDKESTRLLPLRHLLLDFILPVEKTPTALALREEIRKNRPPAIAVITADDKKLVFFLRDGRIAVSVANPRELFPRTPYSRRPLAREDLRLVRKLLP